MKYTGRMPRAVPHAKSSTASFQGLGSFRARPFGAGRGASLPSPSRFIQSQGGMEALLQSATKGVLERGEKLGINQAVRDAMGEIRRNVQHLQDSRQAEPRRYPPSSPLGDRGARGVAALERRNQQLAAMLDETIDSLKAVVDSKLDDRAKSLELIELAAAKMQFVKIYLEDSTMEVPEVVEGPSLDAKNVGVAIDVKMEGEPVTPTMQTPQSPRTPLLAKTPVIEPDPIPAISTLSISGAATKLAAGPPTTEPPLPAGPLPPDAMDTETASGSSPRTTSLQTTAAAPSRIPASRPAPPIPTRSTLAQSSFAWMLEPDSTPLSSSKGPSSPGSSAPSSPNKHRKRPSGHGASRGRNAFLFGEVISSSSSSSFSPPEGMVEQNGGAGTVTSDEIFGLEPLRSRTARTPL
jgi:TBC1 domain family member 5